MLCTKGSLFVCIPIWKFGVEEAHSCVCVFWGTLGLMTERLDISHHFQHHVSQVPLDLEMAQFASHKI